MGAQSFALREFKMHVLNFVYVCLNLSPFLIPAACYTLWRKGGARLACSLGALVALDLLLPLRKDGPWLWWCKTTLAAAGKLSYHKGVVKIDAKLDSRKNYLLLYHPHALWGYGFDILFDALHKEFGITTMSAGADAVFCVPLLRRVMAWWGLTNVSRKALLVNTTLPYPRNVLGIAPGGIAEMFYGLEQEQLVLAKRKGFCKVALESGASLLPYYVFGANELYTRYWGPGSLAARLSKKLSMSIVFWTDRFGIPFGFVPHACKLVCVVGPAINVEKVESPTQDQIDALHMRYVVALRDLFEKHKSTMGKDWNRDQLYLEDEVVKVKAS
eukprot:TRINITY_DN18982_c0_g1_i1.p1 TRINITY_DN18982_c0_g1~~TRINITY_DN18982_c0_g1_i1.p1  ORF type:complete len:348 (-),score=36.60 TRINITY_DN18982_c0_g1_i1:93-1079(-)